MTEITDKEKRSYYQSLPRSSNIKNPITVPRDMPFSLVSLNVVQMTITTTTTRDFAIYSHCDDKGQRHPTLVSVSEQVTDPKKVSISTRPTK